MPKSATKNKIQQSTLEIATIALVKQERATWEDAVAFVSDRVAFAMRPLIRQLRKNFWGVFDLPVDPQTGNKKIWIPLTESFVDAVVKNIDLDTKDINFRAKREESIPLTSVVRHITKNYLDVMLFGEYLDELEKNMAIDGTAVWKTISIKENGKYCTKIRPVDLLNIYIDPTAHSIKEAYRFTERALLSESEVEGMTGWINTAGIEGTIGLNPTDSQYKYSTTARGSKFVDIWELWGKIPKYLITGNIEDKTKEVEGHLVVSGLDAPGKERCHLIEINRDIRPYEEAWYSRVPGRWYGKGIAEKLLMLQLWVNTVVNIRINRARVAQLGLFKIRKGAGITPQMLSRLPANGAVVLNNMDDLEQLAMEEASESSYTDEQNIWSWGQKVTSAFDSVIGEQLPASTPATNAAISNQNSQSAFALIREQLGMFLQRWVKNHALPTIFQNITKGDLIRMSGDDIKALDEKIIYEESYKKLDAIDSAGFFFDPKQVQLEIERAFQHLDKIGADRFVELVHELDVTDYDTEVYVTNEEFDKGVMTQNLMQQLQVLPALQGSGLDIGSMATSIIKEAWDLMGLDSNMIKQQKQPVVPPQQQQQPGQNPNNAVMAASPQTRPGGNAPAQGETPSLTSTVAQANTPEGNG